MIKLDIISDVACPWCYVGKAYLDRALEERPDHPFEIEWHPYQLNPDMPPEGMNRQDYMAAKFGSRESILRIHEPLLAHAEKAGVEFDLPAVDRSPNTLDAHRLIHWAGLEGRQTAMVSVLFRAYWREGKDIGDRTQLADLAEGVGLDRSMIAQLLDSDADRADISARVQNSRTKGVSGVPAFVIAGRHVVQGAQPTEVWTGIIDDINAQLKERSA
ncbi:DsbA family oxidoreductase [Frigidibacter sp. RF13]|uniref:DsbA family oxidoreductase n=1 Tax=Frigidibacter sp. RF13 TaxID=2997340 RepID=UPI00226F81A3|nr:DsbA family oxidoreductase [Frigidibacter sp. RF13]MCY1125329.1 DsbA family oxidoreductase [Frigidibacter sp. RF13]